MRLGLFGGTFDPIHLGHLIVAETAREACRLDRVWFIPAGEPPHKQGLNSTMGRASSSDRLEMVRIAIAGHPAFETAEHDLKRPGPHYSVDLLKMIREERPQDDLFFIIGADSLADLPHWREPREIARLATIVAANRSGVEMKLDTPELTAVFGPDSYPLTQVLIPSINLASRELRKRVSEGRSIRYLVPRGVEAYIQTQGLYNTERHA